MTGLRRALAVVASAAIASGCFVYRAAEPSSVQTGEAVRIALTPSGAQDVTQQVGPRVESLDGRVIASRDSALAVAVTQLTRSRATEEFWTGDSVVVPMRGVGSLEVRRFDRKRSALAVGATTVAVFVMRRVLQETGIFGGRTSRQPGSQ